MDNKDNTNTIIVDNTGMEPPPAAGDIYQVRSSAYFMYDLPGVPKCSIIVTSYNRIEKVKYCVDCIMKYAGNISYELILVDNGSDDGTFNYFQSVPYENKTIIRIEKNIGIGFSNMNAYKACKGKYIVHISDDVYLTENALCNLLYCLESDPSIGAVVPMSSNVSNSQLVEMEFNSLEEMQRKAAVFNKRDPSKWEERIRLVSIIWFIRREIFDIAGVGDPAYIHEYGEDDVCIRLRRAGYKLIACGDTWVHHDHDVYNKGQDNPEKLMETVKRGREVFSKKYHGISANEDIMTDEKGYLPRMLEDIELNRQDVYALCVDVRCGSTVLEIRNIMRRRGIDGVYSCAFTTKAKYYLDLQTVSDDVQCDRTEYIQDYYANGTFDIVVCAEPVNTYTSPVLLMQKLYNLLKPGGILVIHIRNTDDYNSLVRAVSIDEVYDNDKPVCMSFHEAAKCLQLFGGKNINILGEDHGLNRTDREYVERLIKRVNEKASETDIKNALTRNYYIRAIKG